MLHQQGNVVATLGQRRQVQRDDVDAVVEVLPEAAGGDLSLEVAVGRRHDTDVHVHVPRRADRTDLPLLEHAQHLALQRQRHVADLVEEHRAAVGRAEQPVVVAHCAGEGPAHVAEQLRFEQLLRDRRAVHGQERPPAPLAPVVDRLREQFLAGAGLARHQHAHVGRGHGACLVEQRMHEGIAGDHGAVGLIHRQLRAGQQGTPDLLEQCAGLVGLGEEAEHALARRLNRLGDGAVRGEDDDREQRGFASHRLEQREPVHATHAQVGDEQLRSLRL